MFSSKNKIDKNLKYYLSKNLYKKYRVLINYKNFKESIEKKITSYGGTVLFSLKYSNIICANINSRALERLCEYPEISFIQFDEYLFLCGISVNTANKIHLSEKYNLSGKGVGVGIVDSGIYPHADLLQPSNKIEYFKDLVNNLTYPYDDNGHGTCTAGIIASSGISSNNMYRGIAPHSKLFVYKAFDKLGKGFASTILASIEELIEISENNNIRILCLPFELLSHNIFIINAFNSTFDACISKGIIPIVPSGSNQNIEGSIMGIATLDNCITVSGVDTCTSTKAYNYSSSGPFGKKSKPNLSAACANITSLNADTSYISEKNGQKLYPTKLETSYKTFSGTSLAAAFISGICALLFENSPNMSFKDLNSLLKLSCDLGDLSKIQQGEGLININKLLT